MFTLGSEEDATEEKQKLTTNSAPNINKFKDLLDRAPKLSCTSLTVIHNFIGHSSMLKLT